jgi:hypothetical protein
MLRLRNIGEAFTSDPGVRSGNLIATLTLAALIVSLLFVALGTIVLPLILRRMSAMPQTAARAVWPGALYFSTIGAGFMLCEIALIQRLAVFLGHPAYALGVLLFTIILSTGIGSYASEHLPLTKAPWRYVYPLATAIAILVVRFALTELLARLITAPLAVRITACILVISPLGLLLGFFFPTGMRIARSYGSAETPWYWALNGIFGVLFSAVAVFISIYVGISFNLYFSALLYALLPIQIYFMVNHRANQPHLASVMARV